MIYDRPYMRPSGRRPSAWTAMHWILFGTIGVFVLQLVAAAWFNSGIFWELFALSGENIRRGYLWTPLTYGFLHAEHLLIFHLGINMLLLYLFGRELVVVLGNKLFCWLYFVSALLGGVFWLVFNFNSGTVIGASGAVLGVIIFFICMNPNRPIGFFFLPITFTPKTIACIILGINVIGFLFFELPGTGNPVAYSAHLGGALAGYLFFKLIYSSVPDLGSRRPAMEAPTWFRKKTKTSPQTGKFQVNVRNRKDLQQEVDRILDKINSEGFGSLSEEEKKILEQAKDILSR